MAYIIWLDEGTKNKRAKVSWECRTLDGSRKRRSKTFPVGTRVKDINDFKRKVETEYENGQPMDFTKRTFGEFVEEYLELTEKFLSPSTVVSYRQALFTREHGIVSHLGKIDLQKLNTVHVQRFVNYLMEEKLSPKTIKNSVMIISAIYKKAMKLNYVDSKVNIVQDVETPKLVKKSVDSYTEEEVRTLLELVDESGDEMLRLAVYIAIFTGMRRSEINGITIEAINFDKGVLHVFQSKVTGTNGDEIKTTKTSSSVREIPLNESVIKVLKTAVARYNRNKLKYGKEFQDSRLIFCDERGVPLRTNWMSTRYSRFVKKNADKLRYLPLHAAGRHTFASIAIANGADVKTVQTLLGHSDASVTLNTYASAYMDKKKAYVDKMDEMIFARNA